MPTRQWTLIFDEARVDVWFRTRRGKICDFAVTLSAIQKGRAYPVVRYDTAHGVVHRHTFWQGRERIKDDPFGISDPAVCFRLAYQDIKENFGHYLERFAQRRRGR